MPATANENQRGPGPRPRGRSATLYVVHGSHPCNTVMAALRLKGIDFKTVEIPPPSHLLVMKMLFGGKTVPAIKLADGTKIQGSRAILAELERRVPEPALLPTDPDAAAAVLDAEQWGDDVLQPYARRVIWPTLKANTSAAPSFGEGGKLPLPGFMLKASMPMIARAEMRINKATADTYPADLRELPAILEKIDGLIANGVLGGDPPNRADLQIAPSVRLLMAIGDLRAIIEPRPCGQLALRLFPDMPGSIPVGSVEPSLLAGAAA